MIFPRATCALSRIGPKPPVVSDRFRVAVRQKKNVDSILYEQ